MSAESPAKPLCILYLEDDLVAVEMVRSIFSSEGLPCTIRHVDCAADYEQALSAQDIQLILSDFNLPDIDGFTALKLRNERRPELPFVFVSGTLGEQTAVETLKRGATDFVLKDALMRLPSTVSRAVEESLEHARRKKAEEQLRLFSEVITQSTVGVEIRDPQGTFVFANRRLEQITGRSSQNLAELPLHGLYEESTSSDLLAEIEKCRATGQIWAGEINLLNRDGELRYVRGFFSSLKDQEGKTSHWVRIFEDLTDWRLEQHKRQELEKQLLQAQKMEAIGALAGGIAHDFNNILTAIIGFSELSALSLPESSEDGANVRQILMAGRRAKDLVAQILSFSRMQDQSHCALNVSHAVADVLRLLRATLPSTIEIHRALEPGMVKGNPTQIHQVVMNLCTNAEHAMRGKPGRLTVTVKCLGLGPEQCAQIPPLKPGRFVRISVADTGHGMDEAVKKRIFERFYTTKKAGEGSGLGLAVVQSIVQNHQGAIAVESRPGEGARFDVYLPEVQPVEAQRDAGATLQFRGKGRIAYVVDDEISILTFLGIKLERLGFVVRTFRNSRDVRDALLGGARADLLFTDQTMPGLTGTDLIKALRAGGSQIPAILSSGYGSEVKPGEVQELPGVIKINKPFTEVTLIEALTRALGG